MKSYTDSRTVINERKYDSGVSLWKWCDKYGLWTIFSWVCQISEIFFQIPIAKWIKPWLKLQSKLTMFQATAQMWLLRCLLTPWRSSRGTADIFSKDLIKANCSQTDSKCECPSGPKTDGICGQVFSSSGPYHYEQLQFREAAYD